MYVTMLVFGLVFGLRTTCIRTKGRPAACMVSNEKVDMEIEIVPTYAQTASLGSQ